MKHLAIFFFFALSINLLPQNKVVVLTIDATINPAIADYIESGLEKAYEMNAECVIVKLNTPGGLLKSTRVIVSSFLQAKIPVVVYVWPSGAQAASAGVFITMAGHIAVMAPGTNIGAAHPVTMDGQADTTMITKATNDAAAFIRTISEKRNRNIQWAEDAVRKSLSITETEALKINVIDIIAKDINELLEMIDGIEVELENETRILDTRNVELVYVDMNFQQDLLNLLSDPNIAYILFMLGLYGLLFELYSPGAVFPGVIGGICIILAFYAMHTLPINYAGIALIILAVILFVLEIKVVSHGVLTIGGIIALLLGSIMLFDVESTLEVIKVSWEIIIFIIVLTILFFVFAIAFVIRTHKKRPTTGIQGMLGEVGITITNLEPDGSIKVHGEIWNAYSETGKIKIGSKIKVVGIDNLKLIVKEIN